MIEKLSRDQLIELVEKLLGNEGTEQEDDDWIHFARFGLLPGTQESGATP